MWGFFLLAIPAPIFSIAPFAIRYNSANDKQERV
jgi:hypothetical protein